MGVGGDSSATSGSAAASGTSAPGTSAPATSGASTSGSDGIGSGTQVVAPVAVPINLGATSAGLLGDSSATNTGTGSSGSTGGTAPTGTTSGSTTSGSDGVGSGTQVVAPITAPINLGSTSAGLLGDSSATNTGTVLPVPRRNCPDGHELRQHHFGFGWHWFGDAGCCSDYGSDQPGFHLSWSVG